MTTQEGTGQYSVKFFIHDVLTNLERLKKHELKYKTEMTWKWGKGIRIKVTKDCLFKRKTDILISLLNQSVC